MSKWLPIVGVGLVLLSLSLLWPKLPVSDLKGYFDFADARSLFGIRNFNDVASNVVFFVVGLIGLNKVAAFWPGFLRLYGLVLVMAVLGTGAGSIYFHLDPNEVTIFWDRLPMVVGFCSLVALFVADRVDGKIGLISLVILLTVGVVTLLGWHLGWLDLRPYFIIQFGSLLFIAILVLVRSNGHFPNRNLWVALFLYALAKVFELADTSIFELAGFVSGHTLKHLVAGMALLVIFTAFPTDSSSLTGVTGEAGE